MYRKLALLIIVALFLLFTPNCENEPPTKPEKRPPSPDLLPLSIPIPSRMTLSPDSVVQIAVKGLELLNSSSKFCELFTLSEREQYLLEEQGARYEKPWTWRYYLPHEVMLKIKDEGENYYWEGTTYIGVWPRTMMLFEAYKRKDLKGLDFIVYHQSKPARVWECIVDEESNTIWIEFFTLKEYEELYSFLNSYEIFNLILEELMNDEIIVNDIQLSIYSDGSVNMKMFDLLDYLFVSTLEFEWDADGIGEWRQFKEGKLVAEGSWS